MHNETVKALYDYFSFDDKNDFYPSYLYLKYIDYFLNKVVQSLGMPTTELPYELDPGLENMMDMYIQHISDAASDHETSIYHAKVVRLQEAIRLIQQKEDVNIDIPERVVPFKQAKDIVLHNPQSIAIGRCACRAADPNPQIPPEEQEICMFVGEPVADFIAEQNHMFHKATEEEALKVLDYSREKGLVQTVWFKKEIGKCYHMICNCDSFSCMGIKMWNLLEGTVPILAPSGYVAEVTDDCIGCQSCVDDHFCHFNALSMNEDGDRAVVNFDKCMGCGVCAERCPEGAIRLKREPSKGDPLDLDELLSQQAEGKIGKSKSRPAG
ncbi:MAG: 4Fe-4S binding protein [Dehalococcoidia bacterium]